MELFVKIFDSFFQYQKFVDSEIVNLLSDNQYNYDYYFENEYLNSQIESNWFGKHIKRIEDLENNKSFAYNDIYLKIKNQVANSFDKKIFSKITKKKIDFNENVGVFSFDRVMMGMQRKNELFCKQKNEVVQWSDVDILANKKIITKNEKFEVEVRIALHKNGNPKIKTSNKKIFVYFPQKTKNSNAVELFISGGVLSDKTSEEIIYKAIPTIVIAEELIKKGYKVQINYHRSSTHQDHRTSAIVPIKKFNEPLDVDLLLLTCCDAAYIRFHSFKGILAISNHFGKNTNNNYGNTIYNKELEFISNQQLFNKKMTNILKDFMDTETTKVFITETWNETDALEEVKQTINQLSDEI